MGKTFEATVDVERWLFDRVNKLLAIEDLNECDEWVKDSLYAKEDDDIPICEVHFEGTEDKLFINIRSGSTNYYDDCWVDRYKDGVCYDTRVFDCYYELNETSEFDVFDNDDMTTYIVHFNLI